MWFRVPDASDGDSSDSCSLTGDDDELDTSLGPRAGPSSVKQVTDIRTPQTLPIGKPESSTPTRSRSHLPPQQNSTASSSKNHSRNATSNLARRSTTASKLRSGQCDGNPKYNGPYCTASPVQRSEHTPSPFANPPSRTKSKSTSLRSSLRIRLEDLSSSDDDEDEDAMDSEEEQWPIRRHKPVTPQENEDDDPVNQSGPTFLIPDHDSLQVWDQQGRKSTYQLSMRKAQERRRHFEQIHTRTLAAARENNQRLHAKNMNELSEILNRIGLDKQREDRLIAEGFQKREQARSMAFEAMIAEVEKKEAEEALRLTRIKQEEVARKAESERQQALKKAELDERQKKATELKRLQDEKIHAQQEQQRKEEALMRDTQTKASQELKIVRENYGKWYQTMQEIKETVLPNVSANESYKSLCRQAKRRITPKVGQLTGASQQIEKVILELGAVLKETKAQSSDVYVWACNHLAKALIKQAETEVTAKLSTVYPLARVVVGLILVGYPELGDVMMARMVKKCFFVVAYRPLPAAGQSQEEYRKQLGYQPSSAQEETSIQHANRMAGIIALFAAICQTNPYDVVPSLRGRVTSEQVNRIPPQLRLDSCWTWFSYILKLPIVQLNPTPKLISTFVEVAGERLHEVYGHQWLKLVAVLLLEGIRQEKASFKWEECRPTIVQLEAILEDVEKTGHHKPSEGRFYEESYS